MIRSRMEPGGLKAPLFVSGAKALGEESVDGHPVGARLGDGVYCLAELTALIMSGAEGSNGLLCCMVMPPKSQ